MMEVLTSSLATPQVLAQPAKSFRHPGEKAENAVGIQEDYPAYFASAAEFAEAIVVSSAISPTSL